MADFTSCQTTINQQQYRLILLWEISAMKNPIVTVTEKQLTQTVNQIAENNASKYYMFLKPDSCSLSLIF